MAEAFLNEHQKGVLFWPDDNEHLFANRLKYTTNYKQILCLMAQLFYRRSTLERSGISHEMDFIPNPTQYADRPPSSQGAEQHVPSKDIKVRYNVFYEDEAGVMNCSDWSPEPGFLLESLDELLCQLPGGQSGMGIKFILGGLGFRVTRSVFDDIDLERVMHEFDRWVSKCTADFDDDMSVEDTMITVDIFLNENKPTPFWIFSCE
ncbi:hypothetical protein MKX08_009238 [Trichoderma sp. CBMAI-0020]|nr:hypothetical protein MKX08_009238 [Trichoderma sp. CBMAI-0020]